MTELIPTMNDAIHVPAETLDVDAAISHAEAQVELRRRLLPIFLKLTSKSDWVFFGDKARITEGGVSRLGPAVGLRITDIQPREAPKHEGDPGAIVPRREIYKDEKGEDVISYSLTCTVETRFGVRFEGVPGSCTTKDKFFFKISTDPDGKPIYREYREVDPNNLKKKAYANMIVNAGELALGIKGLTREILTAAGFDSDDITAVAFKGKTGKRETAKKKAGGMPEALAHLIELCMSRAEGDKSVAKEYLKVWSEFEGEDGQPVWCKSFEQLKQKPKWAGVILGKAREDQGFDDEFSTWKTSND